MFHSSKLNPFAFLLLSLAILADLPATADVVSPHIRRTRDTYSQEAPNSAYYGTGEAGRLSEASALRFEGEHDMEIGEVESAFDKLAKAVQLDPGNPTCHLLYARAATTKLLQTDGYIDENLLYRTIREWKMLWRHDADNLEQTEARIQARKLLKIARTLEKKKKDEAEVMLAEKLQVQEKKK